jgi:hypothetical protein
MCNFVAVNTATGLKITCFYDGKKSGFYKLAVLVSLGGSWSEVMNFGR